MFQLMIMSIL